MKIMWLKEKNAKKIRIIPDKLVEKYRRKNK